MRPVGARGARIMLGAAIGWQLREIADLSASAFQTLAILEGAGEPLTSHFTRHRWAAAPDQRQHDLTAGCTRTPRPGGTPTLTTRLLTIRCAVNPDHGQG